MVTIHTGKLSGRLEKLIDFRVGIGASERNTIVLQGDEACPSTDGTQVFLPRRVKNFVSERDNKLSIANSTAHESDHIREYDDYFGKEVGLLRERGENLVRIYHERNLSELKENPALAGWIDNIVKDRRIDSERREQLPGVKRHYEEVLNPATEYFRPSIKGMNDLDSFREQYLQRALIGRVIDPIPEKHRAILDEIVEITNTSDSIQKDPEVVTKIYQIFKENFDINQPISRLPPTFGTGDHSQPLSGGSQQGYDKTVKPREGRSGNDEGGRKPKWLDGGGGRVYEFKEEENDMGGDKDNKNKEDERLVLGEEDSRVEFYNQVGEENEFRVTVLDTKITKQNLDSEAAYDYIYAGEVDSMKRIFRQLQARHYGEKRDFEGQDLDYEQYMQGELEARVTGIRRDKKVFRKEFENSQKAVWGIHADTSGSTQGSIIESIKAAFYIFGNGLSASDHNYGLYSSSDNLNVLKSPDEKWNEKVNRKIASLKSGGGGIYLDATSQVIAADLRRVGGKPRGLIVISDFEVCGFEKREKAIIKELYDKKIYPFLIAIGKEHEENAKILTEEVGSEHYSVIPLDKLHELPGEMFRLFKTYGISR